MKSVTYLLDEYTLLTMPTTYTIIPYGVCVIASLAGKTQGLRSFLSAFLHPTQPRAMRVRL